MTPCQYPDSTVTEGQRVRCIIHFSRSMRREFVLQEMSFSRDSLLSSRSDKDLRASYSCCCRADTVLLSSDTSPNKLHKHSHIRWGYVCWETECVYIPELGLVSAQLHVGSEGSVMQSRLSHSERSFFIIHSLLQE